MKSPNFLSFVHSKTEEYSALSDEELRDVALNLSFEAKQIGKVGPLLPRGFALVRAVAQRKLQMSHYDVQLSGGRAMCNGHIVEMRTGEGKTLAATLPLFIHALQGRGTLLATSNDYLAKRDAEWMNPVYQTLGMSVGVIQTDMSREQRRGAYQSSITYGTMKEFGFDFLRDHSMERNEARRKMWFGSQGAIAEAPMAVAVHRQPHFLLIDEADSILIDEARTPLIISEPEDEETHEQQRALYRWSADHATAFEEDTHYWYDRERRKVDLSPDGTALTRAIGKPEILAGVGLLEMYDFVERSIQVARDYTLNKEYVIRDDEIVIVDEATGRISEGRRWSRGIHQAIEAKEHVTITMDTNTSAKITVQAFVARFPLIAGMTGTAASSSKEFRKIYRTPVTVIPPNRPSQREMLPTILTRTEAEKWEKIVDEIATIHALHRPVLVGTKSIAKSEVLSGMLKQRGVEHEVLNARQVEREAEIVASAGERGRVTVATNMAGRGTDIKITDEVKELGGLHVIGTELHSSQRIDLQLFGRCGRQGDPGSVRQFISAEDDLLDMAFGKAAGDRYRKTGKIRSNDSWIRLMKRAQQKVENQHYRARKILMYNEKMLAKSQREMGLDPILDNFD